MVSSGDWPGSYRYMLFPMAQTIQDPTEVVPSMEIHLWEVWHTSSCYLSQSIPDLRTAAIKLLKAGFARAAVLPSGEIAHRRGPDIAWCQLVEEDAIGSESASISFTGDLPDDEKLKIPFHVAAVMRLAARHVFAFHAPLNDESIHLILPDLTVFLSETKPIRLEVTARLFQSGIVLMTFRLRLALDDMPFANFIHEFVNLPLRPLLAASTGRDLTFLSFDAVTRVSGLHAWNRRGVLKLRRLAREEHLAKSEQLATEWNLQVPDDEILVAGVETSQLSGLSLEYTQALAYSLGRPRTGIPYILFGEPDRPEWVGFWAGSPSVHLIRFSGQKDIASENEREFGEAFKWILARSIPRKGRLRPELPKSMHSRDDFAVYVNEASVLGVYSSEEEDQGGAGTRDDPLHLQTYHYQAKVEFLEYGRILYKCLRHELNQENLEWDKIFSIRDRQLQFELELQETGRFGEIRDFLAEAFRARRIPELKEQNSELLGLRESIASVEESRRFTMTGIVLALLLGLLGIPGVVEFLDTYIAPHIPKLAALRTQSLERTAILGVCAVFGILGLSSLTVYLLKRRRWVSRKPPIERS
jgi:hypothetical protein